MKITHLGLLASLLFTGILQAADAPAPTKLNTTAVYTQVATQTVRAVVSPLDRLALAAPARARAGAPRSDRRATRTAWPPAAVAG